MPEDHIRFLDAATCGGAVLIRLQSAVAQTGIPEPTLRRNVSVEKIGRTNYVSVREVNAHVEQLVSGREIRSSSNNRSDVTGVPGESNLSVGLSNAPVTGASAAG